MKFPTVIQKSPFVCSIQWKSISSKEECSATVLLVGTNNRSVQVSGLMSEASIYLLGSNDNKQQFVLRDDVGNELKFTSPNLKIIKEFPEFVKPLVEGGIDSDITVTLFLQGIN